MQGAGCRVQGSGFRVESSGFRVWAEGPGLSIQGAGFRVRGSGCSVGTFPQSERRFEAREQVMSHQAIWGLKSLEGEP